MPQDKLHRCVEQVKGEKGVDSAYAICNSSINEAHKPYPFPVIPSKQSGRDQMLKHNELEPDPMFEAVCNALTQEQHNPMDIINCPADDPEREAVAIGGGLSGISIGGKKKTVETLCSCDQFDNTVKALRKETNADKI